MKKKILILIIIIVLSSIILFYFNEKNNNVIKKNNNEIREEIIETEKINYKDMGNDNVRRGDVLADMTITYKESYLQNRSFLLNPNDPSSKIIVGAYKKDTKPFDTAGDYLPGGIILLRPLKDRKYSIYLEIRSEHFGFYPESISMIKDINKDGLIDIITKWNDNDINLTEFWIVSINPKDKTYKILNPIIDKDENPVKDFDITKNPNGFNRFSSSNSSYEAEEDVIVDLDNDGINEIKIKSPSMSISSPLYGTTHIFKWNGSEYYLWQEFNEPDENYNL